MVFDPLVFDHLSSKKDNQLKIKTILFSVTVMFFSKVATIHYQLSKNLKYIRTGQQSNLREFRIFLFESK